MASEANVKAEGLDASESFSAAAAEAAGSEEANEPTAQHDDTEAPRHGGSATAPAGVKLCGVCNTNPSKYKCPRCFMPYCSVACNKVHRENHPPDPEPKREPESQIKQEPDAPANATAPSTDPRNPFRALDSSDKLKMLFAKYPDLPDQLSQIHAATLPPKEATDSRGIPISLMQGAPNKKRAWNHDVGIQNGKTALRKARKANGEEGKGVREYTELVLYLLNQDDSKDEMTSLLRQQNAEQDSQLIERLMAEEKR